MVFNWNKFPWTNLHDLNLDWIIQTVKTLENNLADAVRQFPEIVNTAVGAERTERIAKDAEIQAEITTEVYPAITRSITDTLTGGGDLTISKTGDIEITSTRSVTIYPVKIPDVVDTKKYAANVEYVDMVTEDMTTRLDNDIDTERTERLAGDAALQSTIDNVIMPLLNAVQKRAPRVFYFENDTTTNTTQFMTAEDTAALKAALVDHTPIVLIAKTQGTQYCYLPVNCSPVPTSDNINDPNTDFIYTFQSANNIYRAMVSYSSSASNSNVVFQTIS